MEEKNINPELLARFEKFKREREDRRRREEEFRRLEFIAASRQDEVSKAEVLERESHRPFAVECRDAILQHDHEYVKDFCVKYGHKAEDKAVNARVVDDILKAHGDLKNDPRWELAKLVSKTIHVDKDGKIKNAMSFPSFNPTKLSEQEWEESDLRKFFKRTIFLLTIMREDENGDCYLEDCRIWHMPNNVTRYEVKDTWEDTVSRFKEGNVFKLDDAGKPHSALPGATFNGVLSVAAHAASNADTIAIPTKDNETGKEEITKQSFWICKKFLQDTIDHGHAYHLREDFGYEDNIITEEDAVEDVKEASINPALLERYQAFKDEREERRRREEELRQLELEAVAKEEDEIAKKHVEEREQHRPFAIICRDAILQHDHEYVSEFCGKYGHNAFDKGVNSKVVDDILREHGDLKNDPRWEQSKLVSKTIHVDKDGKVKQAMSFPSFDPSDLITQEWESSDLRIFFKRTIFLLTIMREDNNGNCYLEDCRIWHMPNNVSKVEVAETWLHTVARFKDGLVFNSEGKQVLPGAKLNGVLSVGAHAASTSDTLALPVEDKATGKTEITRQSFWICKKFLQDTIDHGHAYHLREKFGSEIAATKDEDVAKHEAFNDEEVPNSK